MSMKKKMRKPKDKTKGNTPKSRQSDIPEFDIREASEGEVLKIITHMKKSKVCGEDNIPNKVIYDCRELILRPLTHIINLSIRKGYFPKGMENQ